VPFITAQDIDTIKGLRRTGRSPIDDRRLAHVHRYLATESPVYSLRASAVTSKGIRRERMAVIVLLARHPYVRLVSVYEPTRPAELSCGGS
jgi:hypothetical protein